MSEMTLPTGQPASATANVASSQERNLPAPTARPTSPSPVIERPLTTNPGDMSQQLQLQLDNLRSAETPPFIGNLASLQDQLEEPSLPIAQSVPNLQTYEEVVREGSSVPTVTNKSAPQMSHDRVSGGSVETSGSSAPAARIPQDPQPNLCSRQRI